MRLDAARAIIANAPNTTLADAARSVLAALDRCDIARVEAAEGQLRVQADALLVASEEASSLDNQARAEKKRADDNWAAYQQQRTLTARVIEERDRLARELAAAGAPDVELNRLKGLESAAIRIRDAQQPRRACCRSVYDRITKELVPHLTPT